MNDEEMIILILDGNLSKKKRRKIFDELDVKESDWTRMMCNYVLAHPEKYKDMTVTFSLVEVFTQLSKIQDIIDRKYECSDLLKIRGL